MTTTHKIFRSADLASSIAIPSAVVTAEPAPIPAEDLMTRNQARQYFDDAGLTYSVVTAASKRRLISLIDMEMRSSGVIRGSLRMQRNLDQLRCKAFYFDNREAVTFNSGGFIGFAGWADDQNVQPILRGFMAWVDELQQRKAA